MRAHWAAPVLACALALGSVAFATDVASSAMTTRADQRIDRTVAAAAFFPQASRRAFSVPIRVVTERGATVVFVQVMVNGRGPYEFILDTGASSSSVDRSLAQQLQLPLTGATAYVQGIAGEALAPVVRVRDWTLGGLPLRARNMPVFELGNTRIAGLLGSDELKRFGAVTVDYQRQRLTLHNSAR